MSRLYDHEVLGYLGEIVDDLLIAGPRSLNDAWILAVHRLRSPKPPSEVESMHYIESLHALCVEDLVENLDVA